MAIQEAVNTMLGTAAVGAAGAKHMQNEADSLKLKKAELGEAVAAQEKEVEGLKEKAQTTLADNPELTAVNSEELIKQDMEDWVAKGGEFPEGSPLAQAQKAMENLGQELSAKEETLKATKQAFEDIGKSPLERFADKFRAAEKFKTKRGLKHALPLEPKQQDNGYVAVGQNAKDIRGATEDNPNADEVYVEVDDMSGIMSKAAYAKARKEHPEWKWKYSSLDGDLEKSEV